MKDKINLRPVYLDPLVINRAKDNAHRVDPKWSLAQYIEHVIAVHELVLNKEQNDES